MVDAAPLIGSLVERLAPLDEAAGRAWWTASTDASPENEAARVEAELALTAVLGDPTTYAQIRDADSPDAVIARQLAVLRNRMTPHQVPASTRAEIATLEAAVDGTFNRHRGRIHGEEVDDNAIAAILRTSDSSTDREAAWLAAKSVGPEVAADVRRLAHLRNDVARSLGARDHFALTLETQELDENELLAVLAEVDAVTRPGFTAWKAEFDESRARRFELPVSQLAPWHYDDPFFQAAPRSDDVDVDAWLTPHDQVDLTVETYRGLGIDVADILGRSDLTPRAAKSQHAFCIDVDRAGDIRVLSNNVPGEYWTETMLHEFGHAVYDAGVDPTLPWALRTMHPLTTEGVAMLFGRLPYDPEWLTSVAHIDPDVVQAAIPQLARHRHVSLLVFARWVLVMTNFERALYADPDQDLDTRWWDLVGEFQLLRRPAGRTAPDWATKIHVALAPVYYQNYLLGELVASQLQATVAERYGGIAGRPAVGGFLHQEFFAPGWSVPWSELVARTTGGPLSVDAFGAELAHLAALAAE